VGGYDLGPLLYDMFGYQWLMLITVPVGIILILALTISLVVARRLASKRKAQLAATVESAEKHEI
jgi:MFS family permease